MSQDAATPSQKPESLWLNLVFNVALPFLILTKLGSDKPWEPFGGAVSIPGLGALKGLLVALAFPLVYGLRDLVSRKKWNTLSLIGLGSVVLSGGLSLLKLDPFWFAVKEAVVPLLIGGIVVGSQWTKKPLVRVFLLNPDIIDAAKLNAAVAAKGCQAEFDKLIARATLNLGALFLLSAVLNFVIARLIVKSPPLTDAFNDELGRMHLWSLGGIMVPMMVGMIWALLSLMKGIQQLTGLTFEDLTPGKPVESTDAAKPS